MLLTGAATLYLYLRLRDNKPVVAHIRIVKRLLPHQKAMKRIEEIKAEKMVSSENQKEYYTRLTETLRKYIEERYGFRAMEMTSSEIIDRLTETQDRQALDEFKDVKKNVEQMLDAYKFREAQKEAMNLARIGNRYITECEPWKVWKTDPKRVETVLNISLQLVANLAIAFEPFLPFSSAKLRKLINLESFDWNELGSTDLLKPGHQLAEPELLFEKIEDETIQKQLDKLEATKKANEAASYKAAPIKDTIDFETFEKLDIRVGHVKSCEKVKKSKKLLKFILDDGTGEDRTILSGIAEHWNPEELVGKDVLFIANFAPRKMMGFESQGMILSAVDFDGSLAVTSLLRGVKPGSQVG